MTAVYNLRSTQLGHPLRVGLSAKDTSVNRGVIRHTVWLRIRVRVRLRVKARVWVKSRLRRKGPDPQK